MALMQRCSLPVDDGIELLLRAGAKYDFVYISSVYSAKILNPINMEKNVIRAAFDYDCCELFSEKASLKAMLMDNRVYLVHIGESLPDVGVEWEEEANIDPAPYKKGAWKGEPGQYLIRVWGSSKERNNYYREQQISKPVYIEHGDRPEKVGIVVKSYEKEEWFGNITMHLREIVRMCGVIGIEW